MADNILNQLPSFVNPQKACKRCAQDGHKSWECTNAQVNFCWECGLRGVQSNECCRFYLTKQVICDERIDNRCNEYISHAGDKNFYGELRCDGKRLYAIVAVAQTYVTATIDTGSTRSFVRTDCARHLQQLEKLELVEELANIRLADNTERCITHTLNAKVKLGKVICEIPLLMLDDIGDDIVLGMDFLSATNATLSIGELKVTCQDPDWEKLYKRKRPQLDKLENGEPQAKRLRQEDDCLDDGAVEPHLSNHTTQQDKNINTTQIGSHSNVIAANNTDGTNENGEPVKHKHRTNFELIINGTYDEVAAINYDEKLPNSLPSDELINIAKNSVKANAKKRRRFFICYGDYCYRYKIGGNGNWRIFVSIEKCTEIITDKGNIPGEIKTKSSVAGTISLSTTVATVMKSEPCTSSAASIACVPISNLTNSNEESKEESENITDSIESTLALLDSGIVSVK